MTIDSMDALEALEPGTMIRVAGHKMGSRDFTRTEKGFTNGDVEIEPKWFAGYIAAKHVTDRTHRDPEPGDHFRAGSHRYIILSVTDEVRLVRTNRHGTFVESSVVPLTDVREYNWTRVPTEEHPEWHGPVQHLASVLAETQARMREAQEAFREADRNFDRATLDLSESRAKRVAHVHVVADGTSRLPKEKAAGEVPEGVTVTDVVAIWRREFTVDTEPVTGCQCGAVSRSMVAETLGLGEAAEFKFVVDCGRHG